MTQDKAALEDYYDTATAVARKWSRDADVVGVVALGGVARRTFDQYSDIDLAVFVSSAKTSKIKAGEYTYGGFPLDVLLFRYPQAFEREWDDIQREAFSNALVLADKSRRLARLIKKKTKLTRGEVRQRIASRIMHLAWLGIYNRRLARQQSEAYAWEFPADLLAIRGEPMGAHAEGVNRTV